MRMPPPSACASASGTPWSQCRCLLPLRTSACRTCSTSGTPKSLSRRQCHTRQSGVKKKKKANTGQPTQEQRLVRVSVDETLDRRVGFLMQRIKHQLRVVRHHDRLHREELPNDRVVSWVIPVDPAQDVRAVECQRANMTEYRAGAVSHVIRMAMVAAVTPSKTSLMNSSRLCVVVPRVSNGTSAGTTACRNFRSFGAPWTVFATWVSKEHQLEFSPRLSKHARRTLQR